MVSRKWKWSISFHFLLGIVLYLFWIYGWFYFPGCELAIYSIIWAHLWWMIVVLVLSLYLFGVGVGCCVLSGCELLCCVWVWDLILVVDYFVICIWERERVWERESLFHNLTNIVLHRIIACMYELKCQIAGRHIARAVFLCYL